MGRRVTFGNGVLKKFRLVCGNTRPMCEICSKLAIKTSMTAI